jgi:hypothetical protein
VLLLLKLLLSNLLINVRFAGLLTKTRPTSGPAGFFLFAQAAALFRDNRALQI